MQPISRRREGKFASLADSVLLKNVPGIANKTCQKFSDLQKAGRDSLSKGPGSKLGGDKKLLLKTLTQDPILNGRQTNNALKLEAEHTFPRVCLKIEFVKI